MKCSLCQTQQIAAEMGGRREQIAAQRELLLSRLGNLLQHRDQRDGQAAGPAGRTIRAKNGPPA